MVSFCFVLFFYRFFSIDFVKFKNKLRTIEPRFWKKTNKQPSIIFSVIFISNHSQYPPKNTPLVTSYQLLLGGILSRSSNKQIENLKQKHVDHRWPQCDTLPCPTFPHHPSLTPPTLLLLYPIQEEVGWEGKRCWDLMTQRYVKANMHPNNIFCCRL